MRIVMLTNLEDDRSPWDVPANECRSWAYVLGADTRNASRARGNLAGLSDYDIAIVELTSNLLNLPAELKRAFPQMVVVGLVEGWVGGTAAEGVDGQCAFVQACRDVDMLGVLVERALPYYRLYVDHPRKAQWLGIPFPKSWTDRFPPIASHEKACTILLPFGLRPVRSGLAHLLAFRALRERHPAVRGVVARLTGDDESHLQRLGITVEVVPSLNWPEFYLSLRSFYAVLDLDHLATWGRLAADCAAARVPYVGSDATHCGSTLGVLTCDPFRADIAIGQLERLLPAQGGTETEALYRAVVAEQYRRLKQLSEAPSKRRFWSALKQSLG